MGGALYRALAPSGPNQSSGAKDPSENIGTYWEIIPTDDNNLVHKEYNGLEEISSAKFFKNGIHFKSRIDDTYHYNIDVSDSGYFSLWDYKNEKYIFTAPIDNDEFIFRRQLVSDSGFLLRSASNAITYKETDYDITDNSTSGYSSLRHFDKNDKTSSYIVFGGTGTTQTRISFYTHNLESGGGETYITFGNEPLNKFFHPGTTNLINLGTGNNRWKQLYVSATSISTSDERHKTNIGDIPDSVLDAWNDIEWRRFKMKDSVDSKGEESARYHTGAIAQQIDLAFRNHSLNASDYGLFCYDSWEAKPEKRDTSGNLISEKQDEGDQYSLRYEEALCMEAAYQRRENRRLKDRVSELENKVLQLEDKLNQLLNK